MKRTLLNIILAIILIILFGLNCYWLAKESSTKKQTVIKVDTVYNRVVLDSIEYRIKTKDTIIYNIKLKVEEDVKEIINSNDSVALATFNKLVTM